MGEQVGLCTGEDDNRKPESLCVVPLTAQAADRPALTDLVDQTPRRGIQRTLFALALASVPETGRRRHVGL